MAGIFRFLGAACYMPRPAKDAVTGNVRGVKGA